MNVQTADTMMRVLVGCSDELGCAELALPPLPLSFSGEEMALPHPALDLGT
jgi:hypothetical protein